MSIYGECIYQEFQLLAAEGHVVLYTNHRGSGGYDGDYAAVLKGQWGTVERRSQDLHGIRRKGPGTS